MEVDTDNGTYINTTSDGFFLRGADNAGRCYNIKTAINNGLNETNYLIENYTQTPYFNEPTLTFDDSTVYGCSVQLTRQELQDFCQSKKWNNLMIYQNFLLMQYVGKFGNANPHYIEDWVKVTLDG